jgi:hypothetical protein
MVARYPQAAPETLDVLQREKMSSEPEVRIELQQLERPAEIGRIW